MNEDFIINTKENNTNTETTYYTILGHQDCLDKDKYPVTNTDNKYTCAKKVVGVKKTRFYIKTGLYGKIYNPIGMYSEGTSNKIITKIGKKAWSYKEVNNKVFDMYLSFLKSKNIAWLNNAERELN